MLSALWVLCALIVAPFLFVVFFGAPFVPSFRHDIEAALERIGIDKTMRVVDLGAGDGRVLLLSAERGAQSVGYELNPWLWLISWARTRRYGPLITVFLRNYKQAKLNRFDVVFVFTTGIHKNVLEKKVQNELKQGSFVLSTGFQFETLHKVDEVGSIIIYKK